MKFLPRNIRVIKSRKILRAKVLHIEQSSETHKLLYFERLISRDNVKTVLSTASLLWLLLDGIGISVSGSIVSLEE